MLEDLIKPARATFVIGGQWGSESKGSAVAHLTKTLCEQGSMFDVVTASNGAQSGHTSLHQGVQRVAYHLPTAPLIAATYKQHPITYLNGGAVIDPDVLEHELEGFRMRSQVAPHFWIHPNAAIITEACRLAEQLATSAQTKIASTRKGVGEALSRKVLRSGMTAQDHFFTRRFVNRLDLNAIMSLGKSVLVEVPQGVGLSLDGPFYPYCTSRNCTVGQAMADAGIHPSFYGASVLVLRTFPIRVGNIVGQTSGTLGTSGGHYDDQQETSWNALRLTPEFTTVTKRMRRVFTFSRQQAYEAMAITRPDLIYLTFCNYPCDVRLIADKIKDAAASLRMNPKILYQYGPSTDDVYEAPE